MLTILIICLIVLSFIYGVLKGSRAIYLLIILTSFADYIIAFFTDNSLFTLYREAMIVGIFIHYLVNNQKIIRYSNSKLVNRLLLFSILLYLLSVLFNHQSIFKSIYSIRNYYLYPILFFILVKQVNRKEMYEKIINLIVIIAVLQIPVAAIQYFVIKRSDFVDCTFTNQPSSNISLLGISFIFLFYYCFKYYRRSRIYKLAVLGMIFTLVVAEAKVAIFFLPIAYMINGTIEQRKLKYSVRFALLAYPILAIMVMSFDYVQNRKGYNYDLYSTIIKNPKLFFEQNTRKMDIQLSPDEIEKLSYSTSGKYHYYLDRLASITYSYKFISKKVSNLLFGFGPGETYVNSFYEGSLARKGFYRSFFVITILEIGITGIIIWVLILIVINLNNIRYIKVINKNNITGIWKAFTYYSIMQNITMLMGIFYNTSLVNPHIGLFFWITNGIIISYYSTQGCLERQ